MAMAMRTRSTVCFLFALAFFCVNSVTPVTAQGRHDREDHHEENISNLNLTPAQKKEIIDTQSHRQDELGKIRRALKEKRHELLDELKKDGMDNGKIDRIVSEMKEIQGKLIDNRVDNFMRMKKILTKEQLEKLFDSYKRER